MHYDDGTMIKNADREDNNGDHDDEENNDNSNESQEENGNEDDASSPYDASTMLVSGTKKFKSSDDMNEKKESGSDNDNDNDNNENENNNENGEENEEEEEVFDASTMFISKEPINKQKGQINNEKRTPVATTPKKKKC